MRFLAILLAASIPYIESIEVTINNVDVIVTDRAGNRVHGLQRSDFELLDGGAPQAITNFSEIRGTARTQVAAATPAAAPAGEAVAESAPAAQPRKIVMLFDDIALHPAVAGDFQRRANELIDETLQPGDELMVITPLAKTKIALPFTSDKRAIHKAIDTVMRESAFRANTRLMQERLTFERDILNAGSASAARAGAYNYSGMVARRVRQTLGYLQAVVSELSEVPGKKAVIFVSVSVPIEPGREAFETIDNSATGRPSQELDVLSAPLPGAMGSLRNYVADIARTASTNGVAIYCLQPDVDLGHAVVGDIVATGGAGRGGRRLGSSSSFPGASQTLTQMNSGTEQTFAALADTTGGKWWRGGAGVKPLFQQVADDSTDYYSLGYRAASEERDKARSIVVRVRNHPEYEVRARRAVIRKSAPNEMRDLTIARLLDDRAVDELGVRLSAGQAKREPTGSYLVPVELQVPLSKLTFLRDGDVYRASFRVHYAAESAALDFTPGEGREQVVTVPSAQMPAIGGKFFTYTSSLRVARGETKVSVGVLDPLSKLATIKTMRVDAR